MGQVSVFVIRPHYSNVTPLKIHDDCQRKGHREGNSLALALRQIALVFHLPHVMEMSALHMDNPVLQGFAFYASILIIKTTAMAFLTARMRVQKQVL